MDGLSKWFVMHSERSFWLLTSLCWFLVTTTHFFLWHRMNGSTHSRLIASQNWCEPQFLSFVSVTSRSLSRRHWNHCQICSQALRQTVNSHVVQTLVFLHVARIPFRYAYQRCDRKRNVTTRLRKIASDIILWWIIIIRWRWSLWQALRQLFIKTEINPAR
jgi:hypothetical protein